ADSTFFSTILDHSARRLEWIDRQLRARVFVATQHPTLGMWGLTYKKNTRSVKNSPSLRVLDRLDGSAAVRAWDPAICPGELSVSAEIVADQYAAADDADALLIMCDWDEFARADFDTLRQRMHRPLIIDCAGLLNGRQLDGFEYVSMGRG